MCVLEFGLWGFYFCEFIILMMLFSVVVVLFLVRLFSWKARYYAITEHYVMARYVRQMSYKQMTLLRYCNFCQTVYLHGDGVVFKQLVSQPARSRHLSAYL